MKAWFHPDAAELSDPKIVCPKCERGWTIPKEMIEAIIGTPARCGECLTEFNVTGNRISYE